MKKILILSIALLCCLKSFSQTLTGPSTIEAGTDFVITASGETDGKYISNIAYDHFGSVSNTFTPNGPYLNNDNIIGAVAYYSPNVSPRSPTKFHFKASAGNLNNNVTLHFQVNYGSTTGFPTYFKDLYFTITITPPPITFSSALKSATFTRNNCTGGNVGSTVNYIVGAGSYTSTISQADADAQAQNDVNTNGQSYANANGTCSPPAPIIDGEITICTDALSQYTYTAVNLPSGVTVSAWTAFDQNEIVSTAGSSVTIKYKSIPANPVKSKLTATLSNGTVLSKWIWNKECLE